MLYNEGECLHRTFLSIFLEEVTMPRRESQYQRDLIQRIKARFRDVMSRLISRIKAFLTSSFSLVIDGHYLSASDQQTKLGSQTRNTMLTSSTSGLLLRSFGLRLK